MADVIGFIAVDNQLPVVVAVQALSSSGPYPFPSPIRPHEIVKYNLSQLPGFPTKINFELKFLTGSAEVPLPKIFEYVPDTPKTVYIKISGTPTDPIIMVIGNH